MEAEEIVVKVSKVVNGSESDAVSARSDFYMRDAYVKDHHIYYFNYSDTPFTFYDGAVGADVKPVRLEVDLDHSEMDLRLRGNFNIYYWSLPEGASVRIVKCHDYSVDNYYHTVCEAEVKTPEPPSDFCKKYEEVTAYRDGLFFCMPKEDRAVITFHVPEDVSDRDAARLLKETVARATTPVSRYEKRLVELVKSTVVDVVKPFADEVRVDVSSVVSDDWLDSPKDHVESRGTARISVSVKAKDPASVLTAAYRLFKSLTK